MKVSIVEKKKLLQQCCRYFKSNPGFNRVLLRIKNKYISLGKIGGTIKLEKLSHVEREALSGYLKDNYYKDFATIKIEKFQNALEDTPFKGLDLIDVLNEYFGEQIITKKESQSIFEREREEFYQDILNQIKGEIAFSWLKNVLLNKSNPYSLLSRRYDTNKDKLKGNLILVSQALNNLPYLAKKKERLAVFSSQISKNPHEFDDNADCGTLLMYGIVYFLDEKYPENAEDKAEILYKAGLIRDEISNFTTLSGLISYTEEGVHQGWEGFYKQGEPLQVSLWNISLLKKVLSPKGIVFVFENPTVFSEVLYKTSDIKPALICTYGNVKLASLILLDFLAKEGTKIYYSGDIDPEGLIIADKLKKRYGENLYFWRFSIDDYSKILSQEYIEDIRLKKLDKVKDAFLLELCEHLKQYRMAGYQELLVDELVKDINNILEKPNPYEYSLYP